jgi:peroxiredoxin
MPTLEQPDLLNVDWTQIPPPTDDGGARHLEGSLVPDVALPATDGTRVLLATQSGKTVVFVYPRTGVPDEPALVPEWDMIPGARGCTPQSCAFRDLFSELRAAGAESVFGLSTQPTGYQREAATRLHLPFSLLSDELLAFTRALRLPTLEVANTLLLQRLAMVIENARIVRVWYPVFPPDRNAGDVLAWLQERASTG